MSSRVLPVFAAAILITVGATAAQACDGEKSRSAKAASAYSASAEKSCGTKSATKSASMTKVASKSSCSTKKSTTAAVASASTCQVGKAANAVFASAGDKASHCNSAKQAMAAGKEYSCESSKAAAAVVAMNSGQKVDAVLAGSSCATDAKSSKYAHGDCESCADWSNCEGELAKAGSQMQVVPLKNGVMYVFTSTDPNDAGLVQAVLSSRTNRVKAMMAAGDKASLCGQCKSFRGAIASGNLTREVVNIEGGSLMIMTSPDNKMVNQLYSLAGLNEHVSVEG